MSATNHPGQLGESHSPAAESSAAPVAPRNKPLRKRRWFQYGLRSLFALTALVALATFLVVRLPQAMDEEDAAVRAASEYPFVSFQYLFVEPAPPLIDRVTVLTRKWLRPGHKFVINFLADQWDFEYRKSREEAAARNRLQEWENAQIEFDRAYPTAPWVRPFFLQNAPTADIELDKFPYLSIVDIRCPSFNDQQFDGLRSARLLHIVRVRSASITGKALDVLPCPETLQTLTINEMPWTRDDVAHIARFENLKNLDLCGTAIDIAALRPLARLPKLWQLDLKNCPNVRGQDFSELSALRTLEHLDLSGCGLTDTDLTSIVKLTQLKSLRLENNGITSDGVRTLVPLANLTGLSLRATQVDESVIDLIITEFPKLHFINLQTRNVSVEAKKRLKARRFDLVIVGLP